MRFRRFNTLKVSNRMPFLSIISTCTLKNAQKYLFIVIMFIAADVLAQYKRLSVVNISKERKQQEAKLKSLANQIKKYDQIISKKSKEEKVSLEDIELFNQQMKVQTRLILELENAQTQTEIQIRDSEIQLDSETYQLETMKVNFARFAVGIYKYGSLNAVEAFFTAETIGKGISRAKYAQTLQQIVKLRLIEISRKLNEITETKKILDERHTYNTSILNEKKHQIASVVEKKKKKETLVVQLQTDKKRYKQLLEDRQKKVEILKAEIQRLITAENQAIDIEEKERKRLTHTQKKELKKNRPQPFQKESPFLTEKEYSNEDKVFLQQKGHLRSPIRNGVIYKPFGESTTEGTHVKMFNNGIDFSTPTDSPVSTIYDGKVSTVTFLPTFGNIVIVRHAQSFISVYANLDAINVVKGSYVKKGTHIGNVTKHPSNGYIFHFELWEGRKVHDPLEWISKS